MSRGDSRDLGLQLLQALVERHRVRAWDAEYDLDAVAAQRSRKPRAAAFQHHCLPAIASKRTADTIPVSLGSAR